MFLETILADAVHIDESTRKPTSPIAGTWRNRLGSRMDLVVEDDHRVHGHFHTGVGGSAATAAFPVAGFIEGDAVSFCVDFGRAGSVASWSGHHIEDEVGERLTMLWHLARPVLHPHTERDVWLALIAGADEFTKAQG